MAAGFSPAAASFLTGAHPRESGSDIRAGVSADQIAAEAIDRQTRLASLELGLEDHRVVGLCDGNYSCAYTSCISWRTPTTPLPPVPNPKHVFERLFGTADPNPDPAAAARKARYRRSIPDGAVGDARGLRATLGPRTDENSTNIRPRSARRSGAFSWPRNAGRAGSRLRDRRPASPRTRPSTPG